MSKAATIGAFIGGFLAAALGFNAGWFVRDAQCAELPDVSILMARVERVLVENGYGAKGYAKLNPPAVFLTDDPLPRGDWGWSVPGTVLISSAQPEACVRITLAHELAHDATRRLDLINAERGAPAWAIKAEMEAIAATVEMAVEADGAHAPNCLTSWRGGR